MTNQWEDEIEARNRVIDQMLREIEAHSINIAVETKRKTKDKGLLMKDLIDLILAHATSSTEDILRDEIAAHQPVVLSSAKGGNRQLVKAVEDMVRHDPAAAFVFDQTDNAILKVNEYQWNAGRFETPTITELKMRAKEKLHQGATGRVHLWVLDGANPVVDIGSLQASCSDTLFQVASQFNCLESPGPFVTDVAKYFHDPTQGPRAAISAFPATILRHYQAPGTNGERFIQQTNGQQIELLADACGSGNAPNGYFDGDSIKSPEIIAEQLENQFDKIRVGLHDQAQVLLGYNWDGSVADSESRLIAQVFTSTVAGGSYGGERNLGKESYVHSSRQLLRAAYLGTLLAAIVVGRQRVMLTLIGGGVFENPINLIWDSILWAIEEAEPYLHEDLYVFVNGFHIGNMISLEEKVLPAVREHQGAILRFSSCGLASVMR